MKGHFISLVKHLIIGKPVAFYRRYETTESTKARTTKYRKGTKQDSTRQNNEVQKRT